MLNDALASSHFAIAGKLTGHDAIVVDGACAEPSVLLVDGDGARLEPAGDLWGLPAAEAEAAAARAPRQGVAGRRDRPGGRAPGQVRDDLPRRPPRRPRRPRRGARREEHQGDRRAAGDEGRAGRPARPCSRPRATCARARSAPRPRSTASSARSPTCSPSTRSRRCRPATSSAATFDEAPRLAAEDLAEARGVAPRQLRLVHDRLRAHLQGRRRQAASASSTSRLRARPAVRRVATPTPSSRRAAAATSSGSTRSRPAARSPWRWSAPSAA